jgi:hypothetical protein
MNDVSHWSGRGFGVETLEARRLLSTTLDGGSCGVVDTTTTTTTGASTQTAVTAAAVKPAVSTASSSSTSSSASSSKVAFSDTPAQVQSGLEALAQGVTIADAQSVRVITRSDGTTTCTTTIAVNGKRSRLSVISVVR